MGIGKDRDIKDSPAAQANKPVDCVTMTEGSAKPNRRSNNCRWPKQSQGMVYDTATHTDVTLGAFHRYTRIPRSARVDVQRQYIPSIVWPSGKSFPYSTAARIFQVKATAKNNASRTRNQCFCFWEVKVTMMMNAPKAGQNIHSARRSSKAPPRLF